jgi:hypothetical protein
MKPDHVVGELAPQRQQGMSESPFFSAIDVGHKGQFGRVVDEPETSESFLYRRGGFEQTLIMHMHKIFDNNPDKMVKNTEPLFDRHSSHLKPMVLTSQV